MRALTVEPGRANSLALSKMPEPPTDDGPILVRTRAIGICGTDSEIMAGNYGTAPEGESRLIVGHESLGVVEEAGAGSGFVEGESVVGIVRRPDPVPCANCAIGEWDMCRNGLYTERGIKGRHGYASERFRIAPAFLVRVDPALNLAGVLLEPASVVAKAWEQIERIGARALWKPKRILVTGAGPIGLLAALMAIQRGYEVRVFDRNESGLKPDLVRALGADYVSGELGKAANKPDIVLECTGATAVIVEVINRTGANGIVCLTGVSSGGHQIALDVGLVNRTLVLENDVVFGSVNANRRHYEAAASSLAKAPPGWLDRVISHRSPLADWKNAFSPQPDAVKRIIEFEE
jgi:threonine dehydrogenase-like Zn-dependent dehydrogenase